MTALRLQTVVDKNGTLTLRGLPSLAGHKVDILVRDASVLKSGAERYPLRGRSLRYDKPFDSVAEADWEASR
jgi:hypothetical protein